MNVGWAGGGNLMGFRFSTTNVLLFNKLKTRAGVMGVESHVIKQQMRLTLYSDYSLIFLLFFFF